MLVHVELSNAEKLECQKIMAKGNSRLHFWSDKFLGLRKRKECRQMILVGMFNPIELGSTHAEWKEFQADLPHILAVQKIQDKVIAGYAKLLKKLAAKFSKMSHGTINDFEDWEIDAWESALSAVWGYTDTKIKFITFLSNTVMRRFHTIQVTLNPFSGATERSDMEILYSKEDCDVNRPCTFKEVVEARGLTRDQRLALIAVQAQQYNEMGAARYAAGPEEYRIRHLLRSLTLVANSEGGCSGTPCDQLYAVLRPQFLKAVTRYTNDVVLLNRITASLNLTAITQDTNALLGRMQNDCAGNVGVDCAFSYKLLAIQPRPGLEAVEMDSAGILKPSLGRHPGPANVNASLLAPVQLEVAVCSTVPPLLPGLFTFAPKPFTAIGRAAATAVMVEQDWMQPGQLQNPFTPNLPFQPIEAYDNHSFSDANGYDWYQVDYGGNAAVAVSTSNSITEGIVNDEFSAEVGWWSAVPIHSFAGTFATTDLGCAS